MWPRATLHSLEGHRLETFDLEPPQNRITGQDSLLTSHQSLGYVLDYLRFECCRVKSFASCRKVQTACRVHTASYSTGAGLCLELNRAGVGRAVNHYPATVFKFKERSLTSTHPYIFMACRNNITFFISHRVNCAHFCCAVCHNFCYSYSQSVATFSALIASYIQRIISILYSTAFIKCVHSVIFTYC